MSDEDGLPFGKYYDGRNERGTMPEIDPSSGPTFVLSVFDKRVGEYGCGICKTRLMRGRDPADAVKRYRAWLALVFADIVSAMKDEDRVVEEVVEVMPEEATFKRRLERLQQELDDAESAGRHYPADKLALLVQDVDDARRLLEQTVARRQVRCESRRDRILRPVLWEMEQIDAGRVEAIEIPATYGLPVSYAGYWRGFTTYEPAYNRRG
jgi:hypothetical protein